LYGATLLYVGAEPLITTATTTKQVSTKDPHHLLVASVRT
jgi:hypothetical protein